MTEEKVDLQPLVDEQLPKLLALDFDASIEGMHLLERRTRIAKDDNANCIVCVAIIQRCLDLKRWNDLGVNVTTLAKRRGYSRRSITKAVQLSMEALQQIPDESTRIELIRILRDVTEGKIFVEIERAHLTSFLVDYLEARGEVVDAMNLLQDLRLEILTTMDEKERIGLMLHQFRLCLDCKDQLRASLCAEKIHDQRVTDDDLKTEYLELLIRYHTEFTHDFMEIARAHYDLFRITTKQDSLLQAIVAAVLAPSSADQSQFCAELQGLKDLALMPKARQLLTVFLGHELVTWDDFQKEFAEIIQEEHAELMRKRTIEHGLRVVAGYYTQIRLQRLAELEHITEDELEERIIDLVFAEDFYAKIDRPKGIVIFKRQQKVSEVADEFSANIMKLCKLVDQAHSLIEKERQSVYRPKI